MSKGKLFLATIFAVAIAGCSSGSSGPSTGYVSIALTDAPVDNVSAVVVEFTGISLKQAGGDAQRFDFDAPRTIDLLDLQDGVMVDLLPTTEVPAGEYEWARLWVNAEFDTVFDSWAMTPNGQVELRVPGGDNSGLKLVSGFTVTAGQSTNLVIDWDVRKSLSDPIGQPGYHLRPALRITDLAEYGTLEGTVADALVMADDCTNDLAMDTGNAVYVYQDEVQATLGDIGDPVLEPFVTAAVKQGDDGIYRYRVDYLPVGSYTPAFTCQASSDDPAVDDDIILTPVPSVVISDGQTTVANFE